MRDARCSDLNLGSMPLENGVEKRLINAMLQSMQRPGAHVEHVEVGPKFIAMIAGGRMGLASLLGARPMEDETHLAAGLVGRSVSQAAELLTSASPFQISLGLAALNAANTLMAESADASDAPAETLIAALGAGKTVGLVGEFPFVDALREKVGELKLFEMRDVPGAVARRDWDEALAGLDVLAVTGTAIITRKMGYFLAQAAKARTVVLGPSTPLSPALFDCGADWLCTSVVIDPEPVLSGIRAGMPFYAIKRSGGIRFIQWSREDRH
jgi:hypothetical protein